MADLDKALATQLSNIEKRTGRTLDELAALIRGSGLTKHGELVAMLKDQLGMGYGDANTLVQTVRQAVSRAAGAAPVPGAELDAIYAGAKAALRPIHERLIAEIRAFGPFDEAPKKDYISLRRKKQFAMIGPATKTQVEVGLNHKALPATDRLQRVPPGRMCDLRVRLSDPAEVDAELLGWLRTAYDGAG
jgi:hypothetical protein